MKIIDLSIPLAAGRDIECAIPDKLPLYEGFPCEEYLFSFHSHRGCYFETSAHLFRGGTMTQDVPVEKLMMPAVVARVSKEKTNPIEPEDILAGMKGNPLAGDGLIVDTGGREGYFSRRCGTWMVEKKICLLGSSLSRFDTGFVNPTGIFVELFKAEIPIIAEIHNLEKIDHERIFLIVSPMAIEGVCTVPCRVVAMDGNEPEIEWLTGHLRSGPAK
ncbi:MAG: cyclase family protein [Phycisphaerae bacterium]